MLRAAYVRRRRAVGRGRVGVVRDVHVRRDVARLRLQIAARVVAEVQRPARRRAAAEVGRRPFEPVRMVVPERLAAPSGVAAPRRLGQPALERPSLRQAWSLSCSVKSPLAVSIPESSDLPVRRGRGVRVDDARRAASNVTAASLVGRQSCVSEKFP